MAEKILIIDDEPDMLKLLSMILREKTPYEVFTTNNPIEAVELVKRGEFDLIITDLKMPGLDGLQLLEEAKKKDEDIPVIIITAYGTIDAATEAIKLGAFDFITKPFKKEQILFTIEKAIKWLKVQKENRILKEKLKSQS
ncbi:sigma-54-dependent Fis family transcriptional regulator [Thermodesulfobacterium sp. TA1]|uniref:sigma-54-dependent transcriptional regulator n=1 Tax=Thermodesulfobacterium sp. TA1 TaxID=2234087 RepID=UPI001231F186|nr:response regulator [Thermodesulfobacterium sp. TA1]QER42628.1 sigma-54-dependent Fis family transcriptional regulator [Thermodesulfobacterium sp. TA1]